MEESTIPQIQTRWYPLFPNLLSRYGESTVVPQGHIHDLFSKACEKAHEVYCVDIEEKADIVVSVAGYPADVDLYQSQKALDNGKLALKEGGILILASECRSGIGEEAYFDPLSSSEAPQKALERIEQGYKLGYHKGAKMAENATWADIWG